MQQSEFRISISVESYDEKTAENYRNFYVAEKPIVFKISKISITTIPQIKDLDEDCVKMSGPYLIYFLRNKPSKSVTVGSGRGRPGRVG